MVLFQRVDGPSVLAAIRERVSESVEICDRWRDRVDPAHRDYDPDALYHALRALFDGPCGYAGSGKPILLVLDDFEALLDLPAGDGHWRVKPDAVAPFAAIIRAFDRGGTDSRLLITSRYEFRLGTDGRDPALRLLPVPLAETSPANRLKQARQKVLALDRAGQGDLPPLTQRAIDAARGNAGLQDLLFQAVLADPAAGEAAVRALETYLGGGALPEQEELRATLEKLVIDKLLEPLTGGEQRLLRASTLFQLPVPLTVWNKYAADAELGHPGRLIAFGLWERLPDIVDPHADAASPNAIAAARVPSLPEHDGKQAIGAVLPDLFAAWGGPDRLGKSSATDIELTRLALASGNLDVLVATASFAIRGLELAYAYRRAAAQAVAVLDALESGGRELEIQLLRAAAEVFDLVGDSDALRRVYADVSALIDDPSLLNEIRLVRAQFRLEHGRYLHKFGEPDRALKELQAASAVFEALGDRRSRAVTLSDIARIMTAKGQVERALALHQELQQIFEALGDRRARAVVLGDIARIMTAKGEIGAALALHQEQQQIFEALGDPRSRAVVLGDIARIMRDKGEVERALALHQEQQQIFGVLGVRREQAVVLGDIARITRDKGEVERALALHQEQQQIFEALGDRRSRAVTLGFIARIIRDKGEVERALALHQEQQQIFEALGDRRSLAISLGDIARIMTAKGEIEPALALHRERQSIFEELGDRRERAVTLGDIARIMRDKGEVDAALALYQEELQTYDELGDRYSRAVTLGSIARIISEKGEVDQALKLHNEILGTFNALGARRDEAIALGNIARIMTAKGQVEAALALHQEQLKTHEALGDRREQAIALGDIARIMTAKGRVEAALAVHRQRLNTYEALGARREQAVTLGDIAQIIAAKGDVEAALTLQRERLDLNRQLGDQDGIAAASFNIGQIQFYRAVERNDKDGVHAAVEAFAESYRINLKIGRLDGVCVVGFVLGRALAMAGQRDEAHAMLERSLDGFRKLDRGQEASEVEEWLQQLG